MPTYNPVPNPNAADGRTVSAGAGALSSMPSVTELVYVSKAGNDLTGDGSATNPFLTINHAIESITDAGGEKVYTVVITGGSYQEDVVLKDSVNLFGYFGSTFVRSVSGTDPTASTYLIGMIVDNPITLVGGFTELILSAASDITITDGGSGGNLYLNFGNKIGGSVTASGGCGVIARASQIAGMILSGSATLLTDTTSIPEDPSNLSLTESATMTLIDRAPFVGYAPTTSDDWNTPPTEIASALDELAARVKALEP